MVRVISYGLRVLGFRLWFIGYELLVYLSLICGLQFIFRLALVAT